jgi:adenosine deaminase
VALGLAPSLPEHPLPRLRDAGLLVTLNTDIPLITGTSLTEEYARTRVAFGYGDEVLAELARATVDASFAPATTKERLRREIAAWLAEAGPHGRGDVQRSA